MDGGGIWGPGGASIDPSNGHVFVATGNALTNPESYSYAEDVVELDPSLNVLGANYPGLTGGDVDFGATPILYQPSGCSTTQVAAKNKTGVLVVYNEGNLNAGYTQRFQIADVNDYQFNGIPAWSPQTNMIYISNNSDSNTGTYFHGLIALHAGANCQLSLAWQQTVGPNYTRVSPPTVANGVVYYGDGSATPSGRSTPRPAQPLVERLADRRRYLRGPDRRQRHPARPRLGRQALRVHSRRQRQSANSDLVQPDERTGGDAGRRPGH